MGAPRPRAELRRFRDPPRARAQPGFAPAAAANEHTVGHVFDVGAPVPERDLMYSERPGMPDPPWAAADLVLDLNNDDYFRAPAPYDLSVSSLLVPLPANHRRPLGW